MQYEIILAPEAVEDLQRLDAHIRADVKDRIERHLRYEPAKCSRSRIKRLRGMERPQYRLRVRDTRVFYDVGEKMVEILAIVEKASAALWLLEVGEASEEGSSV